MRYLVGIFLLIFAVINAWRTLREVREGEAYLIVSAGGDGLFGRADRANEPVAFWLNIAIHWIVVTTAVLGGLWILFGATDF